MKRIFGIVLLLVLVGMTCIEGADVQLPICVVTGDNGKDR